MARAPTHRAGYGKAKFRMYRNYRGKTAVTLADGLRGEGLTMPESKARHNLITHKQRSASKHTNVSDMADGNFACGERRLGVLS